MKDDQADFDYTRTICKDIHDDADAVDEDDNDADADGVIAYYTNEKHIETLETRNVSFLSFEFLISLSSNINHSRNNDSSYQLFRGIRAQGE